MSVVLGAEEMANADSILSREKPAKAGPSVFSASRLLETKLAEPRWAVPGILAEGCTILGGKPKTGKSWMALGLAVAVASGGVALGQIPVQQGAVLYLALEDNMRRLQSRMEMILEGQTAPSALDLAVDWPRLDAQGKEWLQAWLDSHRGARLVIVDTLARIRARNTGRNVGLYDDDYHAVALLKRLADNAGASLLVIHHLRKMSSDDPLEALSGTMGLSGAADSILVLKKERTKRDATLFMTGRDIDEQETNIRFDPITCTWSLLGESLSDERQAVVVALRKSGKGLTAKELAATLAQPYANVRALAWKMANVGQIRSLNGCYSTNNDNSSNSGNTGNNGHSDNTGLLSVLPV
jgi:AAA domain